MRRSNIMTLTAVLWILMIAGLLMSNATTKPASAKSSTGGNLVPAAAVLPQQPPVVQAQSVPTVDLTPVNPGANIDAQDQTAVIAPYPSYTVTQGPHGFSYGQMAIDLTAGKGATILSPINGSVTQLFTDALGNPTLIIENDIYQVTLMHGDYTVGVGQSLHIGDPVGTESNNGNTVDWWGNSCRGRDCGYHTHLNIFDKRIGSNVNPLNLIPPSQ